MTGQIFRGNGEPHDWDMPPAPPWRQFRGQPIVEHPYHDNWAADYPNELERARTYQAHGREIELVNVALLLRRPLLVTGRPGTGKSALAYAIAHELKLSPVLRWPITSRSTLQDGLYRYDAIARLQDANLQPGQSPASIGRYLQLGPLGAALLPYERPRVLLIDEIDKSDVDLPNDLLNVLEEGEFRIPELVRIADTDNEVEVGIEHASAPVRINHGTVRCRAFPIVVMTSNGERDFPPAFLRRCVRLDITEPDHQHLEAIVRSHLGAEALAASTDIVNRFLQQRTTGELATDQLLNAIFVTMHSDVTHANDRSELADLILRHLNVPD
ncbi:MoxR family ATPase [Verrucosispora sp. WMMC514]|uniref:AAA family ATPase n=1 Tax=Verrucosispora sp. WMMC514 TaxID=3015156 RepID=UPI00248BB19A|nr:MoxR family ATPase [Verrucosispora sp. WMMC514]WBB93441.1 MoxR family ATPase [Verrucosispora sp. WMMC514]